MSRKNNLSNRLPWQDEANKSGKKAESDFYKVLKANLPPNEFCVINSPKKNIIYSNNKGIKLDTLVVNNRTKKAVYFEIKYGENGGNAHERCYKYLTPLKEELRNVAENTYGFTLHEQPVWFGFSGKTFNNNTIYEVKGNKKSKKIDPSKYRDELNIAFKNSKYYFLGNNTNNFHDVIQDLIKELS